MELRDEDGYILTEDCDYGASVSYNLDADKTYYLKFYSYGATNANFNVNVSMVPAGYERETAIELVDRAYDGTYDFVDENGGVVWFKFNVSTDSNYNIVIDSDNISAMYLYRGTYESAQAESYANVISNTYLYSYYTYYLKVQLNSYSSDDEFAVKVELPGESIDSAFEISNSNYYCNSSYSVIDSVDDTVWFKFTPYTSGNYSFYLKNFDTYYATANVNVYAGSDLATNLAAVTESTVANLALESGVTYYVEVIMTQSYDNSFTIYAAPEGYSVESAVEIDGDDTTVSGDYLAVQKNSSIWFKFTATESKYYKFSHDNSYSNYIYIYSENNTSSYLTYASGSSIMYNMTEGETYYIYIYFGYNYDPTFDLTISEVAAGETRETAIAITSTSTHYDVNITEGGQRVWFKITPSSSGYRSIYLTGMPSTAYALLYTGTNTSYTDYNYGSSTFYVYEYLYYYNTYYVCVYLSNNTSTGSFNIYYY